MANLDFKYLEQDFKSIQQQIESGIASGEFADYNTKAPALASFVELLTESADLLSYYLNIAADEGHLATTEFYENALARASELNYLPGGFVPPVVDVDISLSYVTSGDNGDTQWYSGAQVDIPRYTNIKGTSPKANYSITRDISLNLDVRHLEETYIDPALNTYSGLWTFKNIRLVQGTYKNHIYINPPTEPVNEFTIKKIAGKDIASGYIDVYIDNGVECNGKQFCQWKGVDNIKAYGPDDEVYQIRLTDKLNYTITFGDGVNGKLIPTGDQAVRVFALHSDESGGEIEANILTNTTVINSINTGYNSPVTFTPRHAHYLEEYKNVFKPNLNTSDAEDGLVELTATYYDRFLIGVDNLDPTWFISFNQELNSSNAIGYETVEQIRKNAAEVFSYQGLLMTNKDYLSYIKARWFTIFYDAKVMNNWEFMTTYAADVTQLKGIDFYRDKIRATKNFVSQANSCDFNNVYIIGVPHSGYNIDSRDVDRVVADIENRNLKTFNNELVVMPPIWSYVGLDIELVKDVGIKTKTIKADAQIVTEVHNILIKYFRQDNMKLNQTILKSEIKSLIFAVEGVDNISKLNIYMNYMDDFTAADGSEGDEIGYGIKLKPYQFPLWSQTFNDTLHQANSYIKIITKQDEIL